MSTHPPTMTPPQPIDLDRLNELEAKATPGPWEHDTYVEGWTVTGPEPSNAFDDGSAGGEYAPCCSPETRDFIIALRNAFPAISKELAELRQDLYETNESYEKAAHDRDAAVRDCRKLRAQLATSQESERRMRGLVKKSIDYLRDVFGQDPAELRAELEAALTAPVKAEGAVQCDGRTFKSPLDAALHLLWLLQRLSFYEPEREGMPCDGFRFREGIKEARKLLATLDYEKTAFGVEVLPATPPADEIGVAAINREEGS